MSPFYVEGDSKFVRDPLLAKRGLTTLNPPRLRCIILFSLLGDAWHGLQFC